MDRKKRFIKQTIIGVADCYLIVFIWPSFSLEQALSDATTGKLLENLLHLLKHSLPYSMSINDIAFPIELMHIDNTFKQLNIAFFTVEAKIHDESTSPLGQNYHFPLESAKPDIF